ncbi:MAG: hypothetical protein QOI10_2837 [Solirubrobacterales bacterium]|jgi:hypothetical protein|nr:hypothetical protein [Solirubrobacterales bacterium]
MKRLAISLVIGAAALALLAPSASARFKFFQTPSGNIACAMGGGGVRCDIQEHSWTPPPRPSFCDVDWGGGVQVGRNDPGSFVCAGDTVFSPNNAVLGYGEKAFKNRFTCSSKPKGVRCKNHKSGHGFFLSRESVRLF